MTTIGGKQHKLVEGYENRAIAEKKFHELKLIAIESPRSTNLRVHSLCDMYLDWASENLKPSTYEGNRWYLQGFVEHCGYLMATKIKTFDVTEWISSKKRWNETTSYNGRRLVKRVFNWGVEQQILQENPWRR